MRPVEIRIVDLRRQRVETDRDVASRHAVLERDHARRVRIRQRIQNHAIDHRKDGGVRANGQRQRQHGRNGERRAAAQTAPGKQQLLAEIFDPHRHNRLQGSLTGHHRTAKARECAPPGLFRAEAIGTLLFLDQREMDRNLLTELVVKAAPANDVPEAMEGRHRILRRNAAPCSPPRSA